MKPKKVFAVSSGSYSDYSVNAMFTSMVLAKEYMKFVPDDYYNEVAEYELNPQVANLIRHGHSVWRVLILHDGTVELVDRLETCPYNVQTSVWLWERTKAPAFKDKGIPDALECRVWAKTERHAVKIANEKRARMIASGEWT